ncbi:MAG: carboxypeptidase-like regulatory domain-containing protein, partial [Chitinophagaceae bacterium]|nr:carboxypeptidase-like regulatory domain-containing protein [Chitinophagaceae bacterium]
MRILTLLILAAAYSLPGAAQTVGTVRGKLIDSVNKQSLKDATIAILDARDSTLEVFGLAAADGSFSITNISFGAMILQVKFAGYEPWERKLTFSKENATVNIGNIYLKIAAGTLGDVTVTASPVQMKKDTVEFTAGAFKTKPNAVAEDLLKKIPGMEVDKDGTIKSQGEVVQRVLVNGKRFFGDDPKMATRNLPPDVIDKIQVFDDQSDQAKFTGFDDGNRVKTINITTKKNMKTGAFG